MPIEYHKLENGLKVVLSRDTSSPTAVVGIYYAIGFRIEPKDRTGFAHLFEHMMFQGSEHLGKNEFISLVESNGGVLNGSTRFDFTNYFQIVPVHTLETILWAEADRMWGLKITQDNLTNQQGVVKNEVKVNVLNQPYGGFPWLDLPQHANTNWYNAHNFYGDLEHLDAATLADVQQFFKTYYAPNNAVLVVSGDIDTKQTLEWIRKYFSGIPSSKLPPQPDISEPRQEKEKRANREDPLANRPALALGYHFPPRDTPEYYAMGLIDQLLVQGADSRLYQSLVQKRGLTGSVSGGTNPLLGNMFDIKGPTLWIGLADSRRRQEGRRHHPGDRRGNHAAPDDAGHQSGARARAREAAVGPLRRLRAVRRLRPRQPARRVRAVRRRPGEDQPARGRVPEGHAGDDSEGGPGIPSADQPDDPDHHAEREGELT